MTTCFLNEIGGNVPEVRVGLFVDWNSQIRRVPPAYKVDAVSKGGHALRSVGKAVTKALCSSDPTSTFRVRVRLYHGWTQGFSQTENRRAIAALPEFETPDDIFPSSRVLALGDLEFGDRLLDCLPERLNQGLGIHLPGTFRRKDKNSSGEEKMVDTALSADLLSWAKDEPQSLALVVTEDDDLVPPVFVAESWMKPYGGQVRVMRLAPWSESKGLNLKGLLLQ